MEDLKLEDGGGQDPPKEDGGLDDYYDELGKRLYVAVTSHHMGNKCLDNFRRTYVIEGEPIGAFWVNLAINITKLINEAPGGWVSQYEGVSDDGLL